MRNDDRTKIIYNRTPESAAMLANVKRAMAITEFRFLPSRPMI